MKAIIYRRYGGPDVLELADVERPEPRDDEILIHVRAVEATKADCELRSFSFAVRWFWLPLRLVFGLFRPRRGRRVLGGYFAGVVADVGADVTELRRGDEVFGCAGLRFGAYAEYLVLPAAYTIVAKPRNMRFEEAAAVPLGGLNALHFLRLARIRPGETVLVNGAGGSIGAHAVQIAKRMGAHVTAVDSANKADVLRALGAEAFIDYSSERVFGAARRYDVILDMVAASPYSACIGSLNPGGRYLKANPRLSDMIRAGFTTRLTDKTVVVAFARESRQELLELRDMVEAGELVPIVDGVYPMAQAAEAHGAVEAERRRGAIVISIDEPSSARH